jgi:magnesium-transporting ATPase (P-type)
MGPYHAMMAHFPVALWITASLLVIVRALSDGPLARAFDRVLVPILVLAVVTGVITYVLGLMVWPADTLQTTPLGRNHMMAATWSLFYWTAVLALRWWVGEKAWEGLTNRLIMLGLGTLGAGLLMITGTIGGHLHGAPSFLTDVLRELGWEVYATFHLPNWVLAMLAVVIVAMPAVAIATLRGRAARLRAEGAAT